MILLKRILILEDNLVVLSKIIAQLELLEEDHPFTLSLVVLTNSEQVEDYINNNPKAEFDIILLDRDCQLNGSFHILDFERFGADKVISMSAVEEYNLEAQKRGVIKTILKDIRNYDDFAVKVGKEVGEMLRKMPLSNAKVS